MMEHSGKVNQKLNNVNGFCLLSCDMVIDSGMSENNTEWYVKPGEDLSF
jgi:hypothetical protein